MLMNANKADNSYKHDSDDHNDDEDKDNEWVVNFGDEKFAISDDGGEFS